MDDEASEQVASRTNTPSVSDTVNTPPVRHRRQREESAGDADAANTTAGKSQIASTLPDSKRRRKSASTKGKDRAVDDEAPEAASRTNTPSVAETDEPPSQSTNKCQREASSDVADTANTTAAKSQIGSTSRASKRQKPLTSTKGKGPATAQKLTSQADIPTIAAVQSQVKPTSHGGKKASPSVSAALVLPSTTGNPNVAGTATPKTTPPTSRKRKRTPIDTVAHADQAETAPPTTKRSKVSQFTDTDPDATENAAGESQVEAPSASSTRKPSTSNQATRKGKGKKPAVPHGKKKGKSQAVDNRDPEEVASPTNEEPSWVRDAVEPNGSTNAVTKDMTPQKVDKKTVMEIKMKEMAKKQHEKEKAAHQEKCEVFRFMEQHPEFVSEDRMQITFTENVIRDVNTYMEEAYRDSGDQGNDWRCGDFGCWGPLLEIFELTGKTMSWKCPSRSEWLQNQRGMEWLLYQVLVNAGIQAIKPLKKAQFDDKDEEGWWIKFKAVALATHIDWKAALGHSRIPFKRLLRCWFRLLT